jgi:hypothetical protein
MHSSVVHTAQCCPLLPEAIVVWNPHAKLISALCLIIICGAFAVVVKHTGVNLAYVCAHLFADLVKHTGVNLAYVCAHLFADLVKHTGVNLAYVCAHLFADLVKHTGVNLAYVCAHLFALLPNLALYLYLCMPE